MTETGTPVFGDNIDKLKRDIKAIFAKMDGAVDKRNAAQAVLGELRAKLKELGISKKAAAVCRSYMQMDEDERRVFDFSLAVCREAMGTPLQHDMLKMLDPEEAERETAEA